tara:strand:+ start:128 stop:436 length:309 start_codon:yes stop_codon:yes gene_type:complete
MPKLIKIVPSSNKGKKYDAFFKTGEKTADGKDKEKKVSFGAVGYSDYTKHKDEKRKKSYLARHKPTEKWSSPMTAGSLSRWILWNKTSLGASKADFKRRFNL